MNEAHNVIFMLNTDAPRAVHLPHWSVAHWQSYLASHYVKINDGIVLHNLRPNCGTSIQICSTATTTEEFIWGALSRHRSVGCIRICVCIKLKQVAASWKSLYQLISSFIRYFIWKSTEMFFLNSSASSGWSCRNSLDGVFYTAPYAFKP